MRTGVLYCQCTDNSESKNPELSALILVKVNVESLFISKQPNNIGSTAYCTSPSISAHPYPQRRSVSAGAIHSRFTKYAVFHHILILTLRSSSKYQNPASNTDTMQRAKLSVKWNLRRKSSNSEHSKPVQANPGTDDKMEIKFETKPRKAWTRG